MWGGGRQPIIWQNCRYNCMKMKEIRLRGGASLASPLNSLLLTQECVSIVSYVPKQLRFVPIDVIRDHLLTRGL